MDDLATSSANYEAQIAVIGSMLIDERCIPKVLSALRPEDFSHGASRAVFAAVRGLVHQGRAPDLVTICDALHADRDTVQFLRQCMELTPSAANVMEYVPIVRRGAALLQIQELAGQMIGCRDLSDAEALVRKMTGLLSATDRMPRMTAVDLATDFLSRMRAEKKPEYLPWGIPTLDRRCYAELGDVILLGGYASAGKTLLSIQTALAQARRYKVGYYTLETSEAKMADRLFAHLARVSLSDIKTRHFSDDTWGRFSDAIQRFTQVCPIDFIRASGSSAEDIADDAIGHGYQIVYIDYVQLLTAPSVKRDDMRLTVTHNSQVLKRFAQSQGVATVELAQLRRPETSGKDKNPVPPDMHSFKESGQLEQDADIALLLWPSDRNDNSSDRRLKIGKNKEGGRAAVDLRFQPGIQTMTELVKAEGSDVQRDLMDKGRHVKTVNRSKAMEGQQQFAETDIPDDKLPF